MTKICTKCEKDKELSLFSRDAQGTLGRKVRCKECLAEYAKEWAERLGIKDRKRGWFQDHAKNNPNSRLVYSARDRSKKKGVECTIQPEGVIIPDVCPILGMPLEKGNRKAHDNAPSLDRINPKVGYIAGNIAVISDRANRIKNDATSEEHRKIYSWVLFGSKGPAIWTERPIKLLRNLLNGSRKRAKNLGLDFDITLSDIVVPEFCPILGVPLIPGKGQRNHQDNSPTLDRVNPAKGYIVGNIGVISYRANKIKNNGSAEEHLKIAEWMENMIQCKQFEEPK